MRGYLDIVERVGRSWTYLGLCKRWLTTDWGVDAPPNSSLPPPGAYLMSSCWRKRRQKWKHLNWFEQGNGGGSDGFLQTSIHRASTEEDLYVVENLRKNWTLWISVNQRVDPPQVETFLIKPNDFIQLETQSSKLEVDNPFLLDMAGIFGS